MKLSPIALLVFVMSSALFAQAPPIGPGVSQELARWRAARYSDVRYKLNLTLEKMSPVLKGTIEIRVRVSGGDGEKRSGGVKAETRPVGSVPPIILDWRKIKGHEEKSIISNVTINGTSLDIYGPEAYHLDVIFRPSVIADQEHLIFRNGVRLGENVIKLDFTSPILPSGSAITRYVDKEDGSEYIYSLFVPSDASTAFPVFDQPDLKARFELSISAAPPEWQVVSNSSSPSEKVYVSSSENPSDVIGSWVFPETKPISTYVFAFAAGPWERVSSPHLSKGSTLSTGRVEPSLTVGLPTSAADTGGNLSRSEGVSSPSAGRDTLPTGRVSASLPDGSIYVRRSQAVKLKPHAAEVFRLNREALKYFEQYFDYKFPFPKYDLVLIPEFPFGGMEHAGATFLRESAIIFPQEPTKNDLVSRATLIFHEAAHQWFGDTVTMRWFDDLWLKEGFATFTAYKALEKIMPEMNAWKVFYERIKQGAYQTDSTRGTTAIYQPIANLSAAKSAYGNIVYNKAPAFLRQAEFYLGEDKFQTAVRAFLRKHEFGNAGWEDLVKEFEAVSKQDLTDWANVWVKRPGVSKVAVTPYVMISSIPARYLVLKQVEPHGPSEPQRKGVKTSTPLICWEQKVRVLTIDVKGKRQESTTATDKFNKVDFGDGTELDVCRAGQIFTVGEPIHPFVFPNHGDYGYGIFLLDEKSRDYVLKNIQNEKDPFLRTMMWGALWDGVREGELDPRVFVELVVKVLGSSSKITTPSAQSGGHPSLDKEGRPAATSAETGGESEMRKPAREQGRNEQRPDHALANARASASEEDESTVATLLGRTGTALNYYVSEPGAVATGFRETAGVKNPVATAPGSDLRFRIEDMLIERMRNAPSLGQRITYYRAFLNIAASEKGRGVLKGLLANGGNLSGSEGVSPPASGRDTLPTGRVSASNAIPLKTKDKFDIVTRLLILGDQQAPTLLAELEKTETSDDAKRYAYAARAGIGTAENKAKYWNDFVSNREISESWIEAALPSWNSNRHSDLTLPYLERALKELPNHKRSRKIFFVNGWLGAFIGGQRSAEALAIVNKFLSDNPGLDNDLRLKILENVDLIERAVRIREKFPN